MTSFAHLVPCGLTEQAVNEVTGDAAAAGAPTIGSDMTSTAAIKTRRRTSHPLQRRIGQGQVLLADVLEHHGGPRVRAHPGYRQHHALPPPVVEHGVARPDLDSRPVPLAHAGPRCHLL